MKYHDHCFWETRLMFVLNSCFSPKFYPLVVSEYRHFVNSQKLCSLSKQSYKIGLEETECFQWINVTSHRCCKPNLSLPTGKIAI